MADLHGQIYICVHHNICNFTEICKSVNFNKFLQLCSCCRPAVGLGSIKLRELHAEQVIFAQLLLAYVYVGLSNLVELFSQIRKQAIKDLPSLCRDSKKFTPKVSDILAQLLQADDSTELSVVQTSLITLIKTDPKGVLSGLFGHINSDDDLLRETCIKFLGRVKQLGREVIDKDAEDFLITQCKKVLQLKVSFTSNYVDLPRLKCHSF